MILILYPLFIIITFILKSILYKVRILFLRNSLPERIWQKKREQILSLILKLLINLLHPNPFFIGIDVEIYNEKYNLKQKISKLFFK